MKKLLKRIAPLLLALVMVMGSCLTVSAAGNSLDECLSSDFTPYKEYLKNNSDENFPFVGVLLSCSYGTYSIVKVYVSNVPFYDRNDSSSASYIQLYTGYTSDPVKYYELKLSNGVVTKGNTSTTSSTNPNLYGVSGNATAYVISNYKTVTKGSESNYKAVSSEYESFFPGPPPLVAAVKGAAPEEALKEVILLIPLSILFLAGCLGLRKALRLLLTLLRRA